MHAHVLCTLAFLGLVAAAGAVFDEPQRRRDSAMSALRQDAPYLSLLDDGRSCGEATQRSEATQ